MGSWYNSNSFKTGKEMIKILGDFYTIFVDKLMINFFLQEVKPKPVPDGKSGKPPTKSPRRSVGKSVERVKSPVLTSQNKDNAGTNQSEPVGANDSKRAVPAIGKLQACRK